MYKRAEQTLLWWLEGWEVIDVEWRISFPFYSIFRSRLIAMAFSLPFLLCCFKRMSNNDFFMIAQKKEFLRKIKRERVCTWKRERERGKRYGKEGGEREGDNFERESSRLKGEGGLEMFREWYKKQHNSSHTIWCNLNYKF